jgi:hypothetical protein
LSRFLNKNINAVTKGLIFKSGYSIMQLLTILKPKINLDGMYI